MSSIKVCPNINDCHVYRFFHQNEMRDCMRQYCLGGYEDCARYVMKDAGEDVPATLKPDGTLMVDEEKTRLFDSLFANEPQSPSSKVRTVI